MQVVRFPDALPPDARGGTFAIGNFDGVHVGHRALIDRARGLARERGGTSGVLTFDPHPSKHLNPTLAPRLILNPAEKLLALADAGVEVTAVLPFDGKRAAQQPDAFVKEILVEWLGARAVVVGEGFRFGYRATGTRDDLAARVVTVEVPTQRIGGFVVSSTKVRELVLEGRVDAAAQLLGRSYFVQGPVVQGDQRGRTIGVPTANVDVDRELLPKIGVYATRAILADGRRIDSVTNVGLRPTFQGAGVRIEAHLFDFNEDIYRQNMRLELVRFLRDEQRFNGVEALKAQIARDIEAARQSLPPGPP